MTAACPAGGIGHSFSPGRSYRAPSDYADAFRSLAEAGVLSAELPGRLEQMARFMNLLVHQYADVGDLDRFIAGVLAAFPELGEQGRLGVSPTRGNSGRPSLDDAIVLKGVRMARVEFAAYVEAVERFLAEQP